jgi:predicted metalloendopeptidase
MRTAILCALLGLALTARADSDTDSDTDTDDDATQYRAICVEGFSYAQIWRGPARDTHAAAKQDLDEHRRANPDHTDNSVIRKGDLIWE